MHKIIILALVFMAFTSVADEADVLTVDRVISTNLELAFPNDKNLRAKPSDFELVNYVIMSNELGERWAVLTLTNTSAGNRTLEQDHLLALFADGERKNPLQFKLNFEGRETQSMTVSFGESKFPILSISSRNEM
ncbi:hypothetical protein [Paraglaciecola arctica]|uniref:hypothetical protein n=1 Tax=Paraglaciecola arctica TaxID=1128911 RepID=UPI0005874FD9|nr:hypothetical protein [Paraglaciecola arctica]